VGLNATGARRTCRLKHRKGGCEGLASVPPLKVGGFQLVSDGRGVVLVCWFGDAEHGVNLLVSGLNGGGEVVSGGGPSVGGVCEVPKGAMQGCTQGHESAVVLANDPAKGEGRCGFSRNRVGWGMVFLHVVKQGVGVYEGNDAD